MKERFRKRIPVIVGLTLALILGVTALPQDFLLQVHPKAHVIAERLLGETPTRVLESYLGAISKRQDSQALSMWYLPSNASAPLQERREAVTADLLAIGPGLDYTVESMEWWRNCCEPGPATSPDNAGLARIHVLIRDRYGSRQLRYTLDVGTVTPYWGVAAGNPLRRWRLLDVYPEGDEPLGFPWPRP